MADLKISQLPDAETLQDSDFIPVVCTSGEESVTAKTTVAALRSGGCCDTILAAIDEAKNEILERLDGEDRAVVDSSLSSGYGGDLNTNNGQYYQVRAEIINRELKITLCYRNTPTVIQDQRLSPYGTAAIHLIRTFANTSTSVLDQIAYGFNADSAAETYFSVRPNAMASSNSWDLTPSGFSYFAAKTIVNSIEVTITTDLTNVPEMVIGEFYFVRQMNDPTSEGTDTMAIIDIVVPPSI